MQGRPKEFKRDAALEAATQVFWTRGFESASMSQLLEQMGINRQSAYDTFGDKRALFMQALQGYADKVGGNIRALLTDPAEPSPVQRVRNFLKRLSDKACASDGRGCLLTNIAIELAPHDPEVKAFISQVYHRLETLLAATLQEAVEKRELATDPQRLARLLMTVMQGALVLSKTTLGAHVPDGIELLESAMLRR